MKLSSAEVKYGQKMVKYDRNSQNWSKMAKNGQKWPNMVKMVDFLVSDGLARWIGVMDWPKW